MTNVIIPLATGCEELEAVTIIDLLRRANINVVIAGLDEQPVKASRGTVIVPDTAIDEVLDVEFDMIVLPGGSNYLPKIGTNKNNNLASSKKIVFVKSKNEALTGII